MSRLAAAFIICASPAFADWVDLTGPEIDTKLKGSRVEYIDAWQNFNASGRTLYHAGRDSWGYWRVEGDRYCSQWPPNAGWGCYDVQVDGNLIRFISPNGHTTDGIFRQ